MVSASEMKTSSESQRPGHIDDMSPFPGQAQTSKVLLVCSPMLVMLTGERTVACV
jgi:hypothetical protein